MATTRTRSDLVFEAFTILVSPSAGQQPSAEDLAFIDELLNNVLATLRGREIVYVADANAIQDEWFLPLAAILADACVAKFGGNDADVMKLAAGREKAERDLRVMSRGRPTYEPLRTHCL